MLLNFPDVKVYIYRNRKSNDADKQFTGKLKSRFPNLREVDRVEESNIILVFCTAVSRTGTDIDGALKRFSGMTGCLSVFSLYFK